MKTLFLTVFLSAFWFNSNAQIPTIYSKGGYSIVDWQKLEEEYNRNTNNKNGADFDPHDCSEGVTPLKASSSLNSNSKADYSIKRINDESTSTAWVEGAKGYGIGEYFEVQQKTVNRICNGYQNSSENWKNNSRVKLFKVYMNNIPLCYLQLNDVMGYQQFYLPNSEFDSLETQNIFRFEIIEVYKGDKYDDVAISEIDFGACCFSTSTRLYNQSSNKISQKEGEEISSLNVENGSLQKANIIKVSQQKHVGLVHVFCGDKQIQVTQDHPLFVKDYGFVSLKSLLKKYHTTEYKSLINEIQFLLWNEGTQRLEYAYLTNIVELDGIFETYSLREISSGENYIANGFVTKTY